MNGKMVPLTYKLRNGEQVSVLAGKSGGPSLDWLDPHKGYTRSRRARSRIQHWFRHENREQTIAHGRSMLERELERMNLSDVNFDQLARHMETEDAEELFFKLVDGSIKPGRAAATAQKIVRPTLLEDSSQHEKTIRNPQSANDDARPADLSVLGVTDVMTQLARCCQPVPGDTVVGYVTRGAGITIHRDNCANILYQQHKASERVVQVEWGNNQERVYPMSIVINAFDRKGLLRDVSTVLADEKSNVLELNTRTEASDYSVVMDVLVEVSGIEAMSRLLSKLEQLPNVLSVKRKN